MTAPRWFHETWAIVVAGLLCPPLAIYLVSKKPDLSPAIRSLVLAAMGAVLVSLALLEFYGGVLGTGVARYRAFTLRQRAVFMHRKGNTAQALDVMMRARQAYPNDADVGLDAARLALKAGFRSQAAALLRELSRDPSAESEALVELAALWMDEPADFDRGRRLLEDALDQRRVKTDDPAALVLRGRIELARNDLRSAEYMFRQVVHQFRRDHYGPVYASLAEIAHRRGESKLEVSYLCESLRADWEQPKVRARLEAAAKALGLPVSQYSVFARAVELHDDLRSYDDARALWKRLLEQHPSFLHRDGCHYMLATSYFYYSRDYARALEHYEAVIAKHPASESWLRAIYQSAQCLEKLGRDVEAARTYDRLADAAPAGSALARLGSAAMVRLSKLGRLGGFPTIFTGGRP